MKLFFSGENMLQRQVLTVLVGMSLMLVPSSCQLIRNEALLEAQAICSKYLGISEAQTAQYNASIYPSDRETMCMIRCTGLVLGFWDDDNGLLIDGVKQLFPPNSDPAVFTESVANCVERKLAYCDPTDTCAKAYYAFRCVMRRWNHAPPLPLPTSYNEKLTPEKFHQTQDTCANILRIPQNHSKLYQQGIFPDDPETRCFFRCLGIRTGLYSDTDGPDLDKLHHQFAEDQPLEDFTIKAQLCMEANKPLVEDKCTAAYRNLYLCFREHFTAMAAKHRQTLQQKPHYPHVLLRNKAN